MESIRKLAGQVPAIDQEMEQTAWRHLDNLTKPPGSLGLLETAAARYVAMTGQNPPAYPRAVIYTFAADHGVTRQGVSAYPAEVTPQMVLNMMAGGAAINVLCRHGDIVSRVVDVGVAYDFGEAAEQISRKAGMGTADFTQGPAMTEEQAGLALNAGIEAAETAVSEGFGLIGVGEMGIGNSTSAAALMAALLPCSAAEIVGRGTGVDDAGLKRKIGVIDQGLAVNQAALADPVGCLAAVGGFEICAICGLIIAAAAKRLPVVVDGFISSAAALAAVRLNPAIGDYLYYSHLSAEAGHRRFYSRTGRRPLLDLEMRLGEGTGAALAIHLIRAAIKIYNEMATFDSAGVSGRS